MPPHAWAQLAFYLAVLPVLAKPLGGHLAKVIPDSALKTALSFATHNNWQGHAGESTLNHVTQMAGLAARHFLSAAIAAEKKARARRAECLRGRVREETGQWSPMPL